MKASALAAGALYVAFKYMAYKSEKEHQKMLDQIESEARSRKRMTYLKLTGAAVVSAGTVYLALKTRKALLNIKESVAEAYATADQA